MAKRILKYVLIFGSITLVIWWIQKKTENKPWCKNCNVLLISLDTLSAKHLPCYGYSKNTSPNLCQFGKDNILFTNSYSQSHWTRPSQTSVLTGLHPSTHGVINPYIDKLSRGYETIQEVLTENGYKSYFFGPPVGNDSWDESVIRGFSYMEDNIYQSESLNFWNKALDILAQNKKKRQPTFMYLHTYYVHSPYLTGTGDLKFVSKNDQKKYSEIPVTSDVFESFTPGKNKYVFDSLKQRAKEKNTTESQKIVTNLLNKFKTASSFQARKRAYFSFPGNELGSYDRTWYFQQIKDLNASDYVKSMYDQRIYQMDTELKGFLDKLKNKFDKDTIVVIYADHGETLGERGSYGHCEDFTDCLYMETVKVPLIIRVPGMKSEKIDKLAQGIDIYPTILKLVGIKTPDYIEGEDLFNIKKKFVVSEAGGEKSVLIDKKWALYTRDLQQFKTQRMELYDLVKDPWEKNNVIDKYPKIVAEKVDEFKNYLKIQEVNKNKNVGLTFPSWIDETKKQKLINGGYF